jgi:hypothetical protein
VDLIVQEFQLSKNAANEIERAIGAPDERWLIVWSSFMAQSNQSCD